MTLTLKRKPEESKEESAATLINSMARRSLVRSETYYLQIEKEEEEYDEAQDDAPPRSKWTFANHTYPHETCRRCALLQLIGPRSRKQDLAAIAMQAAARRFLDRQESYYRMLEKEQDEYEQGGHRDESHKYSWRAVRGLLRTRRHLVLELQPKRAAPLLSTAARPPFGPRPPLSAAPHAFGAAGRLIGATARLRADGTPSPLVSPRQLAPASTGKRRAPSMKAPVLAAIAGGAPGGASRATLREASAWAAGRKLGHAVATVALAPAAASEGASICQEVDADKIDADEIERSAGLCEARVALDRWRRVRQSVLTQWDALHQGVSIFSELHKQVKAEQPLLAGDGGGGGAHVAVLKLWAVEELSAMKVIKAALRRFIRAWRARRAAASGGGDESSARELRRAATRQRLGEQQEQAALEAAMQAEQTAEQAAAEAQQQQSDAKLAALEAERKAATAAAAVALAPTAPALAPAAVEATASRAADDDEASVLREVYHADDKPKQAAALSRWRVSRVRAEALTQWELLYQGVSIFSELHKQVKAEQPLAAGEDGGGGARLAVMSLWALDEMHSMKILRRVVRRYLVAWRARRIAAVI